ncbi:hypothetical protein [Sphingomonas azotifigens]|uniref:hypothetical protein n=1 Tax=Sphingomonas azotifigens TaxID=330920 RepID=UPI0009FBD6A0|nr:hypothetical protein [Sphingomonas azotifigens]
MSRADLSGDPANISEAQLKTYLQYPRLATAARYGLRDDVGNTMDAPSILQLSGQPYRYAAVYHTAYAVAGGALRFKVNVAGSNDLLRWRYLGLLVDNASMPRLAAVRGTAWIVLAHEQWAGRGPGSSGPSRLGYKLFYSGADLVNRVVRANWVQPNFLTSLNGTPSFYDLRQDYCGVYRCVSGTIGFHYWSGRKDLNAATTNQMMFDPRGAATSVSAAVTDRYNLRFTTLGVTGNLGQRDFLATSTGRYLVQEGNVGTAAGSWDKWRIYLYRYTETALAPDGSGTITPIRPETPGGSVSFGNPSISVVDDPAGRGKVVVISYFLFSEGAKNGEAGSLLYYYRL